MVIYVYEWGSCMKKIYMDFEMNMNNVKGKKEGFKADLIAIGAIKYDMKTKEIEEFKSLIKPILTKTVYPHIQELTHITTEDLQDAPTYESVMRSFKKWLGDFDSIEGIYTFGNLDLTCFKNTDRISSQRNNHPRFLNNIRSFFVDVKQKYLNYGIKCINYVSLTHLLELSNLKFSGDAHDPLYDAYNLYILDDVLEKNDDIRNYLILQDINKSPFNQIDEDIENKIKNYGEYLYNKSNSYDIYNLSIDIIEIIGKYVNSIRNVKVKNIDIIKDIVKKLDTAEKLRKIKSGYFYILNNFYLDLMDLLDDALLYKLSQEEYEEEMDKIMDLFLEDLEYEHISIDIEMNVEASENLT